MKPIMLNQDERERELCPGCAGDLPPLPMRVFSQTICPGDYICFGCGQREVLDPAWAEAVRTIRTPRK